MSFTGDLEHLPIVDVIQLLHSSRKSGTLTVRCRKGESQLVFMDGDIVCANHPNTTVRIGKLLLEADAITEDALDKALHQQWHAGNNRKPLIATLIECGHLKKEDAYKGLETLIEMTVVEILTWTKGTFSLDVEQNVISDEYRYFPEKLDLTINLDTQSVLMDALRIYDEKMRDGKLEADQFEGEGCVEKEPAQTVLTAEDLGLDELELLDRKIPGVFSGAAELSNEYRESIAKLAGDLTLSEQGQLADYLQKQEKTDKSEAIGGSNLTIILFSPDQLFAHAMTTVCSSQGMKLFTTTDRQVLSPIIRRNLSRQLVPILVIDIPTNDPGFADLDLAAIRTEMQRDFPQLPLLQLISPTDFSLETRALAEGASAVLPRPSRMDRPDSFVADLILFLDSLSTRLEECVTENLSSMAALNLTLDGLSRISEVPEMALALLRSAASRFERAVTLVVRPADLIIERGIGITGSVNREPTHPLGNRIRLAGESLFSRIIRQGELFYGECHDQLIQDTLFPVIGAPKSPFIMLLPFRTREQIISLIYADFGSLAQKDPDIAALAIIARFAGLVIENSLFRKRVVRNDQD